MRTLRCARPTNRWFIDIIICGAIFFASSLHAQSAAELGPLGAFSAIMASPIGALPPLARDYAGSIPDKWDVSARFGTWRYDIDDGNHNTVGVSVTRRIGHTRSSIRLTGAYITLDCDCSVWGSAGIAARTQLFSIAAAQHPTDHLSAHLSNELSFGGAWFTQSPRARARSFADVLDVGFAMPAPFGSRMTFSAFPGLGHGSLSSDDLTAKAWRPMLNGAASWSFANRVSIDVGVNRVIVDGAPTGWGAGLSWKWP